MVISLLENIHNQIPSMLTNHTEVSEGDQTELLMAALEDLNDSIGISVDRVELRDTIRQLVEAGRSISLLGLGEELMKSLGTGTGIPQVIRNELKEVLWSDGWEMDTPIPGVSTSDTSPNLDIATVSHAISTSVLFCGADTREEAIPKAFGNTYKWILHSKSPGQHGNPSEESLPEWLAENSSTVFWITGKPGSGKSTMMKFLLHQPLLRDHLSKGLGKLRLLVVGYYAWNVGKHLQRSFEGLKRMVVSQVLDLDPELTLKLAPRRWVLCQVLRSASSLPRWDTWEIQETFDVLLSECGKTIKLALFIDGLDEFDTPPKDVIRQIQEITSLCPTGLKVCVASRPWNTFQGEYGQGPALQMNLAIHNDMVDFVAGSLKENRAFAEYQALNPQAASQLTSDIVTRANGIFQWVSLVVPLLLELLTNAEPSTQSVDIQQALRDLPTELETLYDAIWAKIRHEDLETTSFMMQIMRAAGAPVPWVIMWAVEDLKQASALVQPCSSLGGLTPDTIDEFRTNCNVKTIVKLEIERKLSSRTRGILELKSQGDGFVDFTHRTARDWTASPDTWERICSVSKETFDPFLYLLEADTATLFYRSGTWLDFDVQLQDAAMDALRHASNVVSTPEHTKKLIECLNALETACRGLGGDDPAKRRWWAPARLNAANTFLGLTAQFSVLPYIKWALLSDHGSQLQKPSEDSLGLLENAIFGPLFYNPAMAPAGNTHPVPRHQSLATVKYLLKHGFYQSKVHTWNGVRDLEEELENIPSTDPEFEYYADVLACLNEMGKLEQMKAKFTSASDYFRSRIGSLIGRDE